MKYLVELGHSPNLARRELSQVLQARGIKFKREHLTDQLLLIDVKKDLDVVDVMSQLGGSLRIAKFINSASSLAHVLNKIVSHLESNNSGRITYSIHSINNSDSERLALDVKKALKDKNISSRFIEGKKRMLSPLIIKSQDVKEIIINKSGSDRFDLYSTQAVTDGLAWQKRDRERPFVDAQSGVMPPKVARMLINLAVKSSNKDVTILDAFCGSGTILMESALLGFKTVGLDKSQKAVSDSIQNLKWLSTEYPEIISSNILEADSSLVKPEDLSLEPVEYIVSEGYLGPSRFKYEDLDGVIEELSLLYQKALPNLYKWLKPKGRLVLALPSFEHKKSSEMHVTLIDTCLKTGYTLSVKPLMYSQPNARVKRLIYLLDKK